MILMILLLERLKDPSKVNATEEKTFEHGAIEKKKRGNRRNPVEGPKSSHLLGQGKCRPCVPETMVTRTLPAFLLIV